MTECVHIYAVIFRCIVYEHTARRIIEEEHRE